MFPGRSNTDMLRLIMEVKGRLNSKMLKRGEYSSKHFDERTVKIINPIKSIQDILLKKKSKGDDTELLLKFADFLEK